MKILFVAPITKGVLKDNLSYFTSRDVKPGALVSIPLRSKTTPAVVIDVLDAQKIKTDLRKSSFSLKPIKNVKSEYFLRPEFVSACKKISDFYVSPLGAVFKDFFPQTVFEQGFEEKITENDLKNNFTSRFDPNIFQAEESERIQYYKSIVREEFAKGRSLFFCLPTLMDIERFAEELQKGIEKYTLILHSALPKKKILEAWKKSIKEKHPLLIVATKSFLSIPVKNLSIIVLEKENSSLYKLQERPYIDVRRAVEILAQEMGIKLIIGDNVLRTETFYKYHNKISAIHRYLSEADQKIIVVEKKNVPGWQYEGNFSVFSSEVVNLIKTTSEKGEQMILYLGRKGFGSTTVCNDCYRTILCKNCDAPLVLYKKDPKEKRLKFVCQKCLAEYNVSEECPYCKSWRLETLGIGIERAEEEIMRNFPGAKIFRIDSDNIKNKKSGEEVVKKFLNTRGGILLTTEMFFPYLQNKVENVAVVSIDPLFSLPDFRINEKIFQLLLNLRILAKKRFYIQTRISDQPVFEDALKGAVSGFHEKELEIRRDFDFPPFKILIRLTKDNKELDTLKKEVEEIKGGLVVWEPISYPAFIARVKNAYSWHILIKVDPEKWPEKELELVEKIKSLPPGWKVNIEPDSLL